MRPFVCTVPLLLAFAGLTAPLASGGTPLAWKKPIEAAESRPTEEELVAVPLDAEVYARASADYADLRILDLNGNEVPYRLLTRTENREETIEKTWNAENLSLQLTEDGLDIRFALGTDDPQPTGIKIETPLQNFEQRVRVFGLLDAEETLLADEAIFDYSQYMDVRRTELPLKQNSFRSFRLLVDRPTSEQESHLLELTRHLQGTGETERQERFTITRRPFRIDRIGLGKKETRIEVASIVEQNWELSIQSTSVDEESRQTRIEFTTQREPLSKLRLVTSSHNFSRRVHLEVPVKTGLRDDWNRIASGTVSRLRYRDIEEQQLELSFPETRSRTFRLIVENRDSPPLAIDGLEALGHVHQLLFLAQPDETYELQYGRETDSTTRPEYDTVAIDRLLAEGVNPLTFRLGAEIPDSRVPPERSSVRKLLNDPYFLTGLVVLMAALLGWGLYGAVKRMNALDETKPK